MSTEGQGTAGVGGLRFVRNVLFSGSALSARALQALMLVVLLTKSLGVEAYGSWVQIVVTVGMLGPVLTLGLERVLVRFLAEQAGPRERVSMFLGLLGVLVVVNVIGAAFLYGGALLLDDVLAADPDKVPAVAGLIAALLLATNLNVFVAEFFRGQLRMKAHAALWVGRDVGWIAIVVGLVVAGAGVETIVGAYAAWLAVVAAAGFGLAVRGTGIVRPALHGFGSHLRYGGWLALTHPLAWLGKYGSVYFISLFLGTSAVGVYGAVRTLAESLLFASGILLFALSPTLVRFYTDGDMDQVRRYMRLAAYGFLVVAAPAVAGLSLFAEPLLGLVTVPEVAAEAAVVAPILFTAMLILGLYGIFAEVVALTKRTSVFLVTTGAMAVVTVALNLALLPTYGLRGSAIAELAAYAVGLVIVAFLARRWLGLTLDPWRGLRVLAAVAVALGVGLVVPRDGWAAVGGLAVFAAAYVAAAFAFRAVEPASLRTLVVAVVRAARPGGLSPQA